MGYFERFLGWRYLFNRAHRALVSVITLIAIAGVMVGVSALIIVIGVIEGIDNDIFGKVVEIQPHLRIGLESGDPLPDPEAVIGKLRDDPRVIIAEPVISRQVMLERADASGSARVGATIVGVEQLGADRVYRIPNARTKSNIIMGDKEILVGAPLAYGLDLGHNSGAPRLLVTTGVVQRTPHGYIPRRRNLDVIGSFATRIWEFDSVTAFVSLATAREVFGLEKGVDFVQLKLGSPFDVASIKSEIAERLGPGYKLTTWEEENGEFFQALKLEKFGLTLILMLVVLVASFNIVGTLILMVMEKKEQIGLLKAIGASDGMIRGAFISAGGTIGLIGAVGGTLVGLGGCWLISRIQIAGPSSAYGFDHLPVIVNPGSVALIAVSSLVISLAAAIFPAAQAARLHPVEALRHD